ncbi:hypothetical protein DUI87_24708 [Hirundo rustica rustica]|uniref:Uncharacterized protein n=1 Tax=Hirundo rustica rustica TaxID=333673 RepID=A0A3M0JCF3_HIRRU|nr:hypothetical protein DUI87_24708 [Hirundo rustica rustica]
MGASHSSFVRGISLLKEQQINDRSAFPPFQEESPLQFPSLLSKVLTTLSKVLTPLFKVLTPLFKVLAMLFQVLAMLSKVHLKLSQELSVTCST